MPPPQPEVPAIEQNIPDVPAPASTVNEDPPTPVVPSAGLQLDVASVCAELFAPKMMSYEANKLFDERYKGQTVRWTGIARRANVYSYDSTFGENDGTKVEFDVHEVDQGYGNRMVKAFVQLPKDASDDIRSRVGQEVAFEGRLLTCEGSSRRVYVADANIVG